MVRIAKAFEAFVQQRSGTKFHADCGTIVVLSTIGPGQHTLVYFNTKQMELITDYHNGCHTIGIDVVVLNANDTRQVCGWVAGMLSLC